MEMYNIQKCDGFIPHNVILSLWLGGNKINGRD
jgi:hypothetical protein